MKSNETERVGKRLRTIDGLRGVAALAVVFYHLNLAAALAFTSWRPGAVAQWLMGHGYLGVDVFFVLSGFVIPYSVARATPTLGFLGRFALRRSLRLDPPYWVAIAAEVAVVWLTIRFGLAEASLPTWPQFWSHLVYAQGITGQGDILPIFWTLCFEIQFYLGFVLLAVAYHAMGAPKRLAAVVLGVLYVASVLGHYDVGVSIPLWFALDRWYQFFIGALTFWFVSGRTTWRPLVLAWAMLAAVVVSGRADALALAPIAASAFLWAAHERDGMQSWLGGRTWQFLGAISYSLYLFHLIFGWRWIRAVGMVSGPDVPGFVAVVVFASGIAVSVASAWIMWRLVETPALGLSRAVSLQGRISRALAAPAVTGDPVADATPAPARVAHPAASTSR